MANELKVTLKKSQIGRPEKHRRILVCLKLTKTNKSIRVKDTPEIRGMIKKVSHLVEVEDIN
ncbi:MAG: 50S ribosomal protein L30 [Deltaproteobacteria bacterium]|nr:50S ribosomal protein L30 [Deltaproteobacteria bacterium]